MTPNGFQAFKLHDGLKPYGKPYASKEAVESTIKIAADLMSDVTYVVLPVYTSLLPIPPFKTPTKDADEYFGKPLAVIKSCGGE
jgi:hypothetical protein